MKRRDTLKALSLGSLGATLVSTESVAGTPPKVAPLPDFKGGKSAKEIGHDAQLNAQRFFSDHEMKTIKVLTNYIIPADGKSGGALEAKVPDFIEFIVKDIQAHQTPMRGGLLWLDTQANKQFGKKFIAITATQQTLLLDQIAYPEKAKPEMSQGVAFFNLLQNLTATGYFTTEIGFNYLGYVGNRPNTWDGAPADVLKQYGVSYDS